tara:strand:- start:637 stop:1293 length:657 start_codon:yes stop_codon:yes gene_type:complete
MERKKLLARLTPEELRHLNTQTIGHYERLAHEFMEATAQHDVSQNIEALLRNITGAKPYYILDLGCGPGRDLLAFKALGHHPVGLDGCAEFVRIAKARTQCEILHQDFLDLNLKSNAFDGVFANASLFHVPTQELERVLDDIYSCLRFGGVFFCSNPRGPDLERLNGDRYGVFLQLDTWRGFIRPAGFTELENFYRPSGKPLEQQSWLATVWRKSEFD